MTESSSVATPEIREAVGIFFDSDKLEQTIADLQNAGFNHDEIGLLADQTTVGDKLAHIYQEINADSDDPDAPAMAFVAKESEGDTFHALSGSLYLTGATAAGGAVVATAGVLGGAFAVAATATAVVGGIGVLTAAVIHKNDAEYLEEQVDEGHLVLFVRTRDAEKEKLAVEVMSRHAAFDPRIHTVKPKS